MPEDLGSLGLTPGEAEHIRAVAERVLARTNDVIGVAEHVAASHAVQAVGKESRSSDEVEALDALIDISSRLVHDHQQTLQEHLWLNRVLPRVRSLSEDGVPGVGEAGSRALRLCLTAYDSRWSVVEGLIRRANSSMFSGEEEGEVDLDPLISMIGRLSFLRLARGIRLGLNESEVSALETWASECAGEDVHLPD